ncbi:hypothetical protein JTB14_020021 [Gonioctena quinquepunctata]|nr:hypothetical protein JTB14_020021 [Gonioctena quinquepunctata]
MSEHKEKALKKVIFGILISAVSAGVIGGYGGDLGQGLGGLGHGLAAVATPTVAVAHGASSHQNNNLLALHPTPVVTKVAAPIAVASPVLATPVHYGVGSGGLGLDETDIYRMVYTSRSKI